MMEPPPTPLVPRRPFDLWPDELARPGARRWIDRLGVLASLACLIHCLATPLMIALLPLVADERFEGGLSLALVALASYSAGASWLAGDRRPLAPFAVGLTALALRGCLARGEADPVDTLLVLVAACGMIVTHVLGLRAGQHGTSGAGGVRRDMSS
ncbi:MerC mercury resistance protein [Nannocystis exedens]|uniref:MerC mercury resistance protein n=1 Tax=Nannocystis exedens TaxID=54 RepID=A0A1I1UDV0_9BACT|nr:MerC domain-containing protein [Nannocystis exedens]PCC71630.1 MerC mercury resistance protein [Nannocystis exedens]SFD68929.1 MerC mercury resistance protein [Nannocystis exedens]